MFIGRVAEVGPALRGKIDLEAAIASRRCFALLTRFT